MWVPERGLLVRVVASVMPKVMRVEGRRYRDGLRLHRKWLWRVRSVRILGRRAGGPKRGFNPILAPTTCKIIILRMGIVRRKVLTVTKRTLQA